MRIQNRTEKKHYFFFLRVLLNPVNTEQRREDLVTSRSGYFLDKWEEQQNKVTNREKATESLSRLVQLHPLCLFFGLSQNCSALSTSLFLNGVWAEIFSRVKMFGLSFTWNHAVCLCCCSISALCQAFVAIRLALWRTMSKLQHLLFQLKPHLVHATITCCGWAWSGWIHVFRPYLPYSLNSYFMHTPISGSYNVHPEVASFFFCSGGVINVTAS